MTIPQVDNGFHVPVNEYDGKITYGEKKGKGDVVSESHTLQLEPSVEMLAKMEKIAQTTFLSHLGSTATGSGRGYKHEL